MSFRLPKFTVEAEYSRGSVQEDITKHLYPKGIISHAYKRAWDAGFTGKGTIVAIIDTGIDSNHPDLKGKVIKSINLTGEPLQESHGTHVAGTIGANGWLMGGAPDVSIIDIKVLGKNGGSISDIITAIGLATANNASIINMSLGASDLSQSDIQQLTNAVQDAWNKGTICIAAAGNEGTKVGAITGYEYPASINKVESIAACDVGTDFNTITLAYFSNENDRISLAACGVNVISSVIGGQYAIYSGTSMSTPHVSAMAAILTQYIRSKYPTLRGSSFSAALVSLIHANVLPINICGNPSSSITVGGKILLEHSTTTCLNISSLNNDVLHSDYSNTEFGLGFLRYVPNNGPIQLGGQPLYYNGIFLGNEITV
jgi:major intracellular serine protease